MSLRAMLAVFDRSECTLAARLVLLALADNAHDDGSQAHPAVSTLARKARCDERTVQRSLRALEASCEIVATGRTARGVTIYHLAIVTPLAYDSGLDGRGDNLSPEVDVFTDRLKDSSGGILPPGGRQPATLRATSDPAGLPPRVQRWIGAHGRGFDSDTARAVFEDSFRLAGAELELAVQLVERRNAA